MPTDLDWIMLKKMINNYSNDVSEKWGHITQENAHQIAAISHDNMNLFHFLLYHELFEDANTIASCLPLFDDTHIKYISDTHHQIYTDLISCLRTDRMITLFENNHSTIIDTEEESYQKILSMRAHNMSSCHTIIDLIDEFVFLSNSHLNSFFQEMKNADQTMDFVILYEKYTRLMPLIYRVINEYYLEYIKLQIRTIFDIHQNSFVIVSEQYLSLRKCFQLMPKKYVDSRYTDKLQNNILIYLATLPYLSDKINRKIFVSFFDEYDFISLDHRNLDGNNICHVIAEYENEILLDVVLNWLSKHPQLHESYFLSDIEYNDKISDILFIENNDGKTAFDILLTKNKFSMISKIMKYVSPEYYPKITTHLINNFNMIEHIPLNVIHFNQIFLGSLNYYIDMMVKTKMLVMYDIVYYDDLRHRIMKLLNLCDESFDLSNDCYLDWLYQCVIINEYELFNAILKKYFINDISSQNTQYLNRIVKLSHEPLVCTIIKKQLVKFLKHILQYHVDLGLLDKNGKNAIINALETQNYHILVLIKNHINRNSLYPDMIQIINNYLTLIKKYEIYHVFSITHIISKIWNSIEFLMNYYEIRTKIT